MKKVVILSGDVHYAFSSEMDYWKKGVSEPSRIIELCSSAIKNEWPTVMKRVLSTGTGQKLLHDVLYPLERVAWEDARISPYAGRNAVTSGGHPAQIVCLAGACVTLARNGRGIVCEPRDAFARNRGTRRLVRNDRRAAPLPS